MFILTFQSDFLKQSFPVSHGEPQFIVHSSDGWHLIAHNMQTDINILWKS